MLDEADAFCADLGEHQRYSAHHRNCAHGLGHGFMGVLGNELFDSLEVCDALTDGCEEDHCYDGVFMQNTMAENDPNHPSEYLEADRPLYPCTDVETRYKKRCYQRQTGYALKTQGDDFARVFEICATAEEDFRPACYQGLGRDAAGHQIQDSVSDAAMTNSTGMLCRLGEDDEARSNCVVGAVEHFIRHYHGDEQAKELCESFEAGLRALCIRTSEVYYRSFQI